MKKILCLLLVSFVIIMLIGCGNTTGGTQSAQNSTDKKWKIGFNQFQDSEEFCGKVHVGIKEAADKYGVELLYSEARMDGTKMIANTQSFIDQGCDLIIDFNWIPEIGATMLRMCNDADVVLISMDTVYEGTYYFGANSYIAGEIVGEYMADKIVENWGGQVDAFVGLYYMGGGEFVMDRVNGCMDKLKADSRINMPGDDMVFIFDSGASDQSFKAKQTVTDFLTAHPDLKHIAFAAHDDGTALGILRGVEASGREGDCYIVSTGGDTPFQEYIHAGGGDVWLASTAFMPESYGEGVIPMAIDILEGKDVPMDVYLNHFALTKDNLSQYYPQ